jgi:hypothetical protein
MTRTWPVPGIAEARAPDPADACPLDIDTDLVRTWLVQFLREEIERRRGFRRVVVGLSGGVDSALTAALCAEALGPEAVLALLLPYRTSSPRSREHALLVAKKFGIPTRTIDITRAVDGYLDEFEPGADGHRRGNVAARQRMIVLFDQAFKLSALPVGTGNKAERLLGYSQDTSASLGTGIVTGDRAAAPRITSDFAGSRLFWGADVEVSWHNLKLTGEYARADFDLDAPLSGGGPDETEAYGGYVQFGYRPWGLFEGVVRYDGFQPALGADREFMVFGLNMYPDSYAKFGLQYASALDDSPNAPTLSDGQFIFLAQVSF